MMLSSCKGAAMGYTPSPAHTTATATATATTSATASGPGGSSPAPAECGYESPEDTSNNNNNSSPPRDSRHAALIRPNGHLPHDDEPYANPYSLNGVLSKASRMTRGGGGKVGIRDRIACYRWTWFTMTMATGGVANVLYSIPYRSPWLTGIGLTFFFLNICLFAINCLLITLRFHYRSGSFLNSFTDQVESLFIPAVVVSLATIFITICQYGVPHVGPWLLGVMEAMFWIYISASVGASAGMYLTLWSTQVFPIHTMTPVWVFPAYPLLLTAPFGANLIAAASSSSYSGEGEGEGLRSINAIAIAVASVTGQGTGFLISFMICAAFLYRLMTQKLPRDAQRPGVFISIGPSAFTAAGLVQLGNQTQDIFPPNFMGTQHAVYILKLLAYMTGLWLWGLSIWFFLVSVGSLWKYLRPENRAKMHFQMTWFSFVFPNTALVTATEQLGRAFECQGLEIFGSVLAAIIVIVWILVFTRMLHCLWKRELLWPKDED
ncbi:voltage-dependent anion channel-domain-containing protein [Podospora didyma]|uniref:Voltage-dependent anion channel-domain-containing protein n=1 Tax=Podospora didyma TaxID=330526 RepID=A0AAE0NTC8_9PEZI|nr:voltage-dependent anion channel-domain-containing protein [Podospora didyma]